MKYRALSKDELAELETEFIRFLATNQVTAADWEKLKQESPDKVNRLIELFSDIVFDKILADINYLEWKMEQDLRTFQFHESHIEMVGVRVIGNTELNFTASHSPEQMLQQMQLSGAQLQLYTGERSYQKTRKEEIFDLMEQGALISKDGMMFKTLKSLRQ